MVGIKYLVNKLSCFQMQYWFFCAKVRTVITAVLVRGSPVVFHLVLQLQALDLFPENLGTMSMNKKVDQYVYSVLGLNHP